MCRKWRAVWWRWPIKGAARCTGIIDECWVSLWWTIDVMDIKVYCGLLLGPMVPKQWIIPSLKLLVNDSILERMIRYLLDCLMSYMNWWFYTNPIGDSICRVGDASSTNINRVKSKIDSTMWALWRNWWMDSLIQPRIWSRDLWIERQSRRERWW